MEQEATKDIYYLGKKAEYLFEFHSFSRWVHLASSLFNIYKPKRAKTICLNKNKEVCKIGADFMHARDNDLFPIKVYAI